MAELKLRRLADRVPVKLTIAVPPELHHQLNEYARAYEEVYGQAQPLTDLVPAMLKAFLASDRAFARRRKNHA